MPVHLLAQGGKIISKLFQIGGHGLWEPLS
jgi:hypothetical protein